MIANLFLDTVHAIGVSPEIGHLICGTVGLCSKWLKLATERHCLQSYDPLFITGLNQRFLLCLV